MTGILKRAVKRTVGRKKRQTLRVWYNRGKRRVLKQQPAAGSRYSIKLSLPEHHTFFGYYDKSPFSIDNRLILAMVLPIKKGSKEGSPLQVGYFDRENPVTFIPVDTTETWSWQLGCRLQWFPEDEQHLIAYNRVVEGGYGCVIRDIRGDQPERTFRSPVYDISRNGRYALSLNFSRLYRLRPGYGYGKLDDASRGQKCPADDGVFLLDLKDDRTELILSLDTLARYQPVESMEGAEHYVNHLAFSPSGNRFMFIHRWLRDGKRFDRLMTSDRQGRHLSVLEDRYGISHYDWKTDQELLAHTSKKPAGTRYYLYRDQSDERRQIGPDTLRAPGHPSYSPDRTRIVNDSYPDKYGDRRLYLCDAEGNLIRNVGYYYSPPRYSGHQRCDLHPRWDRTGEAVCIDSAHEGYRAMYVIRL